MPLYGAGSGQPLDSDLTAIAALSTTAYGRALLELADQAALLSAAGAAASAHNHDAAYQPVDSDLTAIAALSTTAYGRALLALADAAAGRTALDVPSNSDLSTHSADTTSVHGITDTSVLATATTLATAVSDHSADTTSVHGIADTSVLATDAEVETAKAALAGAYRTAMQSSARFSTSGASGSKYWFVPATNDVVTLGTGTAVTSNALMFNFLAADHAVTDLTTTLRLSVVIQTPATAPSVTITCGLYPVVAGGTATLGTVVTGSSAVFTTPAGSSIVTATSGDFTIPSDGVHALGYILSGTPLSAANLFGQLQVRNV